MPAEGARPGACDARSMSTGSGSTPTWNEFEERFLALIRSVGLPDPEVQPWLELGDHEPPIRPDFLWRKQSVIVETDGHKHHGTRLAFETDRRRDQRAAAAGFQTIRVTWRQLFAERERLGRTVNAIVTRAARTQTAARLSAAG